MSTVDGGSAVGGGRLEAVGRGGRSVVGVSVERWSVRWEEVGGVDAASGTFIDLYFILKYRHDGTWYLFIIKVDK